MGPLGPRAHKIALSRVCGLYKHLADLPGEPAGVLEDSYPIVREEMALILKVTQLVQALRAGVEGLHLTVESGLHREEKRPRLPFLQGQRSRRRPCHAQAEADPAPQPCVAGPVRHVCCNHLLTQ